ncbi:hypothetical protein [Ascidiimonas aurantiaca]|uniref:hypothetical protein n=1 Tax=Ascidiimonas aurantiaca TaxID=1685432 RepID=UPI0030ECCDD6
MKKTVFYLCALSLIAWGCNSAKRSQEALNSGNYDKAINVAIKKLQNNKTRRSNQTFIYQLEEAFNKVTERDKRQIEFLKKDNNPANLERIYQTYLALDDRQERIRPLLPLRLQDAGRDAVFKFKNYSSKIVDVKRALSDYLYANASQLLQNANSKFDFRNAYDDFAYLQEINPGFRDTRIKMEEAHRKGTDFVKVLLHNDTQMVLPERLEASLLNFDTYGVNDLWTVYHSNPRNDINYDYEMDLIFRDINISPEQVREKQIIREKQIKDGWKYLLDNEGNEVRDSLGNRIKVDNFRTITCDYYEFTQFKAVQVTGEVFFRDLQTRQLVNTYPLSSEFVFEHIYAEFDGDKRALDEAALRLINVVAVPFPNNEQMVYDAGEDLKQRIKAILRQNRLNQ